MSFIGLIAAASVGLYLICIYPMLFIFAGVIVLAYYLLTEFDLVPKGTKKPEEEKPPQPKIFITNEERQAETIKGMIKPNLKSDEHYQKLAREVQKAVADARRYQHQQSLRNASKEE